MEKHIAICNCEKCCIYELARVHRGEIRLGRVNELEPSTLHEPGRDVEMISRPGEACTACFCPSFSPAALRMALVVGRRCTASSVVSVFTDKPCHARRLKTSVSRPPAENRSSGRVPP